VCHTAKRRVVVWANRWIRYDIWSTEVKTHRLVGEGAEPFDILRGTTIDDDDLTHEERFTPNDRV